MRDMAARALRAAWVGAACALGLAGCGGGSAQAPAAIAAKADATGFTGNGTYWNPAEPGTGFFFEAQGNVGVVTFYLFETTGKPVWYTASGAFSRDGAAYLFNGELQRYSGGQSAGSTTPKTPKSAPAGAVSVRFDGDKAGVQLPARQFTAQRFNPPAQSTAAAAWQPETGIYWNPAESGRGFTIEANGNNTLIGVFHYDPAGEPTWHLVSAAADALRLTAAGGFGAYSNGQALAGAYRKPDGPVDQGTVSIGFKHACAGVLTLPQMQAIPLRRFSFGTLPAGDECRSRAIVRNEAIPAVDVSQTAVRAVAGRLYRYASPLDTPDAMWDWGDHPVHLNAPAVGNDVQQMWTRGGTFTATVRKATPSGLVQARTVVANVVANPIVSASDSGRTCAIKADETVACWELAAGTGVPTPPAVMEGLTNVIALTAGRQHFCALRRFGQVLCWGFSSTYWQGENLTPPHLPAPLPGLSDAIAISSSPLSGGGAGSCALKSDRSPYCGGSDFTPAGPLPNRAVPAGDSALAALPYGCSIGWSGSVHCMSGDKLEERAFKPAAGVVHGLGHDCYLYWNGSVTCWGSGNTYGQLGAPPDLFPQTPRSVSVALSDAVMLAAGGETNCAIRANGTVACWGSNVNGTLGQGVAATRGSKGLWSSATPLAVPDVKDAVALSMGPRHACALQADGVVMCWGGNRKLEGQVGTTLTELPMPVAGGAVFWK